MIKLFHGSDKEIVKPIYGYGRSDCDYGSGFYLSDDESTAMMWAGQNEQGGYINEYEIEVADLNVLWLNHNNDEDILKWMALLCFNRIDQETRLRNKNEIDYLIANYMPDLKNIDFIVGYRADDSYFDYTRSFLSNELPIELLKKAMMLGKLGLQHVLISKKAFESITFVKSSRVEHNNYYEQLEKAANSEYEELLKERKIGHTYLRDIIRENIRHQSDKK